MADKKLSLPTRKNLRDNEDKKKEHLARIEAATGKSGLEFTIKDDIKVAEQLATNGYADRIGEVFYDAYLAQLAEAIEKNTKDSAAKDALNGTWTTNKINFELDAKAEGYQQIKFPNGELTMSCQPGYIWTNISYLGNDIESRLTSDFAGATLSLKSAANLREYAPKRDEFCAAIAATTGKSSVEFTFTDIKLMDAEVAKKGYENRLGEVFFNSYLQQLSESLTRLCANEAAKAALNQKWTSNKVYFELDAKAPSYQNVDFVNGDLRMSAKADYIWSNLGELGNDIPDKLTSEVLGVTLSLKSAQNIREYEEKAQVHLAAIGNSIGRGGPVTFVVEDVKGVDEALNKRNYTNRMGEVIYEAYLTQISEKLASLCKDDMVKEAIGDSFKNNLVFKLDPKAEGYQNCKFVGGNLVMSCKPDYIWTNISTLGEDIEKQL